MAFTTLILRIIFRIKLNDIYIFLKVKFYKIDSIGHFYRTTYIICSVFVSIISFIGVPRFELGLNLPKRLVLPLHYTPCFTGNIFLKQNNIFCYSYFSPFNLEIKENRNDVYLPFDIIRYSDIR